jgi:hypothetical protein
MNVEKSNMRRLGGLACEVGFQRMSAQRSKTNGHVISSRGRRLEANYIQYSEHSLDQPTDRGTTLGKLPAWHNLEGASARGSQRVAFEIVRGQRGDAVA